MRLFVFLVQNSWSLVLASSGMSASGMELAKVLVSGFSCKLVFCGICGSSLEMSHWSLLQLTSWTSSHIPPVCIDAIGMFLPILHRTLLTFRMGIFRCCRVLWSTLCKISSRMTPSGSSKVSALTLFGWVVLRDFRAFYFNDRHWHRWQGYLTLCFDYWLV